jgi:hypothetical protein
MSWLAAGGRPVRRYAVKATPTMILFSGGDEVKEARKDLQGYRTFDALRHYLHYFIMPNPLEVRRPRPCVKPPRPSR